MQPVVESHGYGSAEIYFLGGFPRKEELNSKKALTGTSEATLNNCLREHRMGIKETYRGLFIREKIDYMGSNVKRLKNAISKIDTKAYEDLLFEEIKYVKPNVIVPLDDIALGAVFPHIHSMKKPKGRPYWINCYRGSVLKLRADWDVELEHRIRVIPTYGPNMLFADPASRAYVGIDFERIIKNRFRQDAIETYGVRWVARTAREFERFLYRQYQKNPAYLVFDIETFGGLITCISFCFDGYEGVSVPLMDGNIPLIERALMWQLVARVLRSSIPKVNQNIKYDWTILDRHALFVENVTGDTMLATSVLYAELAKGLDFLTSIYTDIPYYKDEGKEFNPRAHSKDVLYLYNAMDSIATHVVYGEQLKEMKESGTDKFYHEELVPLIKIYKSMDQLGILIDNEQRKKLRTKYEYLYNSNLSTLRSLVGDDTFNPKSPKQVGELIYEKLKFPKRVKTDPETGDCSYRTDKPTLDDLIINYPLASKAGVLGKQILNRVILCRKLAKVIEYIDTPIHPDGCFRGTSNLAGTETGRSSSAKSLDEIFIEYDNKKRKNRERLGRSLQTISKHGFHVDEEMFEDFEDTQIAADLRSMFVPRPGYVFVEGDGAAAEARDVAVLAEDWELLESFDKKPKVHSKTAGLVFGIDPMLITKDFPLHPIIGIALYDIGKRLRHAGHYNAGAGVLMMQTHLPIQECNRHMNKFHETNPKIRGIYHHEVEQVVKRERRLATAVGRSRTFFGHWGEALFKEALAYLPQSRISDLTKGTMRRTVDELGYIRYLTEQHDGALAEIKKDEWERYAVTFKRIYERKVNFINCSLSRDFELSIPCEISMSENNWMDLKEVHV